MSKQSVLCLADNSGNHATHYVTTKGGASRDAALATFALWVHEVGKYADESNAEALVYYGATLEDEGTSCETIANHDDYPDERLYVGPRGGIRHESC